MHENEIGDIICSKAVEIHRATGPGLLESVYESILAAELSGEGLHVSTQVVIPIRYRDLVIEKGFRADIIVGQKVIIEVKSLETINNAHKKQLLTYLKLTDMKLGYLLNFGQELMKDGITRTVNKL